MNVLDIAITDDVLETQPRSQEKRKSEENTGLQSHKKKRKTLRQYIHVSS